MGDCMKNFEYVTKCLLILNRELIPYIYMTLYETYKENWWEEGVIKLLSPSRRKNLPLDGEKEGLLNSLDLLVCLIVLDKNWITIYKNKMSKESNALIKEAILIRNKWAHSGISDFSDNDTSYMLDTLSGLIKEISPQYKSVDIIDHIQNENILNKITIPIDEKMFKSLIIKKPVNRTYDIKFNDDRIIFEEMMIVAYAPALLLTLGYKAIRKAIIDKPFHFRLVLNNGIIKGRKITFQCDSLEMLKFIKETDFLTKDGNQVILDFNCFPQVYANPAGEISGYYTKENKLWLEIGQTS